VAKDIDIRAGERCCFVLDTNVLLYDPNALFVFKEHEVVIPITVIEEIDHFKKDLNETGRNARTVSRKLDELREKGSLSVGVALPDGGSIRVVLAGGTADLPLGFGPRSNDNLILATARGLSSENKVILVTRDTNMRLKGDALGLPTEDYKHAHLEIDEGYTGISEAQVPGKLIDDLYQRGWLPNTDENRWHPHQFVILSDLEASGKSAMVRYHPDQDRLVKVGKYREGCWGIFARNKEQLFALELLLDDRISLVTLDGMAGTGKTLLALAAGLLKVTDEARYRKLVVSRPIFPMGRDLGYLPGDINEKLNPWMKPIFDNLELLVSSGESRGRDREVRAPSYQALLDQAIIQVEPLTYIRGRSLPKQYLIIDEAQNLTPHEVKTVITRAGEGTKVVLTGDPYQIDNPYVDATSNGLTYVVERFKDTRLAGHVTLRKGERSELARIAAKLL
jgi:PhoH-like ATPase